MAANNNKGRNFNKGNNKNYSNNRNAQNGNNGGNYRDKLKEVREQQKAAREEELLKLRTEGYNLLDIAADALNSRILEIQEMRYAAEENQTRVPKEDTKISFDTIISFFQKIKVDFPEKNNVNILMNVLVDLAKTKVNPRLSAEPWHVDIRKLYFGEKFTSYFSTAWDDRMVELFDKYTSLFGTSTYKLIVDMDTLSLECATKEDWEENTSDSNEQCECNCETCTCQEQ